MKKILSLILVLVLAISCFVACGSTDTDNNGETNNGETNNGGTNNGDTNNGGENNAPATKTYYLAIATESVELTSRSGSKIGNNFATVIFDADGKIVAAAFDSTELSAPTLDENGALVAYTDTSSKVESGYKKGQMAYTWGEQAAAFATFIKGKTAAEVEALEVTSELVTGCTMVSTSYSSMLNLKALVVKAGASTKKVAFESATADFTLGAAMNVSAAKNWQGTAVTVTADCAGVVLGADEKVVTSVIDTIEQSYTIGEGNALTLNPILESKLVMGDEYDAERPMPAGRWYAQVAAFRSTAVGKTVAELEGLATENVTGCTINVDGHKAVLIEAANNA